MQKPKLHIRNKKSLFFCFTTSFCALLFAFYIQGARALIAPSFDFTYDHLPIFAGEDSVIAVKPDNFTASTTNFQWTINNVPYPSVSGIGKDQILIKTEPNQQQIISIKVSVNPGADFMTMERSTFISTTLMPAQQLQTVLQQSSKITASFKIEAEPPDPSPGQKVQLWVSPVAFDVNSAKIEWTVNGKKVLSGVGERSYDLETGKMGTTYNIRADVTLPNGIQNSQDLTITVLGLSFYWWADTSTPVWYKGKALPSPGSQITLMAIPEFPGTSAQNLAYRWLINGQPAPSQSGFGKQTFTFRQNFSSFADEISVDVYNLSQTLKKQKQISISSINPSINIYKMEAIPGTELTRPDFTRLIRNYDTFAGSTLDFIAQPFFFPLTSLPNLTYQWNINGQSIESKETSQPNVLTVRSETGLIDNQYISVTAENKNRNLERTSANFNLRYQKK